MKRTTPPSGGAAADRADAIASTIRPAMITGRLPKRSVIRPESGASANIPNVWPLITKPIVSTWWPWAAMWTGVIVMIRTITTCPATSARRAIATDGRPSSSRIARASPTVAAARESASAISEGSGRRNANESSAASPTNAIGTRYGPARRGSPSHSAMTPDGPTRFGPSTAPTVAAQTTRPIADARLAFGARSAATYRESWFDALPKPTSSVPARSSGTDLPTIATTAITAPRTPIA
jgi:hypothetical protein